MYKLNFFILFVFTCSFLNAQKQYPFIEDLLEKDDLNAAKKEIEFTFRSDTTAFDFLYLMGRLERQRKNYLLAEKYMERCLLRNPRILRPYGVLAVLNKMKGDYEKAFSYVDRALKIEPNNVDFINEKATLYYEKGDYSTALQYFKQINSLKPHDSYFIYNIATTLNQLNRYEEAIVYFNEALLLSPTDSKIYYDRGVACFNIDHPVEAIADLKYSLKYNSFVTEDYERPKKYATYDFISRSYKLSGKPLRAFIYKTRSHRYKRRDV